MQQVLTITPQFVTYPPPPPPPESEPLVTELPRGDIFFAEGYGEFAIGDTFIIDNPVTIPDTTKPANEMPTEYVIVDFEGFTTTDSEGYTEEHVQIIHREANNPNSEERAFAYTAFYDAVYREKFVTFTSPAYLVDEINWILTTPQRDPINNPLPSEPEYNKTTRKPIDLSEIQITREFVETVKALQAYYYDM